MSGPNSHPVTPSPTDIKVRTQSRVLEIAFDDGKQFSLPFEFLRVCSPSAEVRGHGPGQETLQTGKRNVGIAGVEPVGNYGIKPIFDDGHDSGIYSWEFLYRMGKEQVLMWEDYLRRLEAAGFTRDSGRDAPMMVSGGSSCSSH